MIKKDIWKGKEVEFKDGEILFKLIDGYSINSFEISTLGHKIVKIETLIPERNLYLIVLESNSDFRTVMLCNEIAKYKGVLWAEPNFISQLSGKNRTLPSPNDPYYNQQWGLAKVGIPIAWHVLPGTSGNNSVMIAVVDSGILLDNNGKLSHPDLMSDRIVLEKNYSSPGQNVNDFCGHGTHIAGIIAATTNNGIGIAGINDGSPVHIFKVSDPTPPSGVCFGTVANAIRAFYDSLNHALADEINLVINCSNTWGDADGFKEICQHIDYYNRRNIGISQAILCASSGNQGSNNLGYPAALASQRPSSIVCVGSCDINGNRSTFSNYGNGLTLLAPGENILSTTINSDYGPMSGTSQAAAFVSGIISLIWSNKNTLPAGQVISTLIEYAMQGENYDPNLQGSGIVTALWDNNYLGVNLYIDTGQQTAQSYEVTLEIDQFHDIN